MDSLELQIKNEIEKLYMNDSDENLKISTNNLINFYRLGLKIMQENKSTEIPENNS